MIMPITLQEQDYQEINSIVLPLATKIHCSANFYYIDNFLTDDECSYLIGEIRKSNSPSMVTMTDTPNFQIRSSKTKTFYKKNNEVISRLDAKISNYLGFEPERSEEIQGQYYSPGNDFKPHTDYFEPNTEEYEKYAKEEGQRTWTFMAYLNDVEEGGTTDFIDLGFSIKPKKGRAVIWNNLNPNGSVNPLTKHWAKPVITGEKFIITKWFRSLGKLTTPYRQEEHKKLPIFTSVGFSKGKIPSSLYSLLKGWLEAHRNKQTPEVSEAIGTFIHSESKDAPAYLLQLDDYIKNQINTALHPILEMWVDRPLEMTATYGIRDYRKGSSLDMHRDRPKTHQVSVILNVLQNVTEDWPLFIEDHLNNTHKVYLKEGDMLLYESARLLHGRPEPLNGDSFSNICTREAKIRRLCLLRLRLRTSLNRSMRALLKTVSV